MYENICGIIHQWLAMPDLTVLQVVGESGTGKSHLVKEALRTAPMNIYQYEPGDQVVGSQFYTPVFVYEDITCIPQYFRYKTIIINCQPVLNECPTLTLNPPTTVELFWHLCEVSDQRRKVLWQYAERCRNWWCVTHWWLHDPDLPWLECGVQAPMIDDIEPDTEWASLNDLFGYDVLCGIKNSNHTNTSK